MHDPTRVRVTGPLMPYAAGFLAELIRKGYTAGSAELQLGLVAHLSRWLGAHELEVSELTREQMQRFLADRRSSGYTAYLSERSLAPLLGYLGVVPEQDRSTSTPLGKLLDEYGDYLVRERGVRVSVNPYLVVAGRFLGEHAAAAGLRLESLTGVDVRRFMLRECSRGYSISYGKHVATALRSLLRYLHVRGLTSIQLAAAVLGAAGWRGSALPRALEDEQVARLVASCNRERATGRRDYAILLLLVRMGLRAGEVAALELEDIDWRQGEMTIRGKGNRQERLPLPVDVGEALVDYLRHGRPLHECGRVFMRAHAPYTGMPSSGVTGVVYRACARAGLPQVGAHRLRHTAATGMLRAGAKLSEVGQVLRHRSLETTAMYAKVDREALRSLAQPWPGGEA